MVLYNLNLSSWGSPSWKSSYLCNSLHRLSSRPDVQLPFWDDFFFFFSLQLSFIKNVCLLGRNTGKPTSVMLTLNLCFASLGGAEGSGSLPLTSPTSYQRSAGPAHPSSPVLHPSPSLHTHLHLPSSALSRGSHCPFSPSLQLHSTAALTVLVGEPLLDPPVWLGHSRCLSLWHHFAILRPQFFHSSLGKNRLDPQRPSTSALLCTMSLLLCGGAGGMVASKEPSWREPEPHPLPAFVVRAKLR